MAYILRCPFCLTPCLPYAVKVLVFEVLVSTKGNTLLLLKGLSQLWQVSYRVTHSTPGAAGAIQK